MTCLTLFEPVWSYRNEFIMEIGDLNAIITLFVIVQKMGRPFSGKSKMPHFFVRRYLGKILKWYETRISAVFRQGKTDFYRKPLSKRFH